MNASADLDLNGSSLLVNSGTYDFLTDASIDTTGSSMVRNNPAGIIEKTAGSGTSTIEGPLTNDGTIRVSSGTLDLAGVVSRQGALDISGGTLEAGAQVSRQQSLDFVDGAGTLSLDNASSFHATISHFSGSAEIDIAGFDDLSQILFHASANGQGGTLTITDGANHSKRQPALCRRRPVHGQLPALVWPQRRGDNRAHSGLARAPRGREIEVWTPQISLQPVL